MRIFCAVRHSQNPSRYYGSLWSANFYPALRSMGHQIIESQVDLLPASEFMEVPDHFTREESEIRARTTEQILAEVSAAHRRAPIDLFLSYFYNSHFDPSGLDELRKKNIPSVNFYCNSIYQFELVKDIASKVDYAWHAEKDARQLYVDAGANPVWVQMAADPGTYHPIPEARRFENAVFVGQRYADRDRWMASLIRAGVPVELYGPGWGQPPVNQIPSDRNPESVRKSAAGRKRVAPGSWRSYVNAARHNIRRSGLKSGMRRSVNQLRYRWDTRALTPLFETSARGAISPDEIARVFAEHEVCLSFSNVWADGRPGSRLIPHVRLRDFEAPMCRTCYLTGYTEEIGEFYEIGKEIDTYRSTEELVDKSRFYLSHPEAAESLRAAGYRRALKDHTWVRRFEQLFTHIFRKS